MNKKRIILSYFILVFMAYILDLITTIIALSFGAVENNPIAYNIFLMNPIGQMIGLFLFTFFWATVMLWLVELVYLVYKKCFEDNLRVYATLLLVGLLIIFYNTVYAIINNLNVLFNLKGG